MIHDSKSVPVASNEVLRPCHISKLEEISDHWHRLVTCFIIVGQCALLDYYMFAGFGITWVWWLFADAVLLGFVIFCFVSSYLYKRRHYTRFMTYKQAGDLPYAYAIWIVNQSMVVVRVIYIYYALNVNISEWGVMGSSMLRVTLGLSGISSFFLLKSLLIGRQFDLGNNLFVYRIGCEAFLDILDAIDFLDVLLISAHRSSIPFALVTSMLAFASATFIIPGVLMAVYSFTKFGKINSSNISSQIIRVVHILLSALFSNLPFFIIRMYIWYNLNINVTSAFIIKNILFVYLNITELVRQVLPHGYHSNVPYDELLFIRKPAQPQEEHKVTSLEESLTTANSRTNLVSG